MKKKSSVIAKLIIPVAVLGCIAIMIAGVSLYSMTAVQKESNQISGEGVRATICMDEINLAFANTQKLTLALCAEPSKDLYEYVASQLTDTSRTWTAMKRSFWRWITILRQMISSL